MPRAYDADRLRPPQPFNVTQPFRPDLAPMTLTRWSGTWKHVEYRRGVSAYLSAPFGDRVGVYSTGFADCLCLILLAGRRDKHQGGYYSAALAHLDGGNISTLDIPAFIKGTGYTPQQLRDGSGANSWFFHLVLAGNPNSLSAYMVERTLDIFRGVSNINDRCITVYRGCIVHGFGATRQGWIGVPTFGHAIGRSPLAQDV